MRRHLAFLLLAACVTFLLGLGRAAIGDSDEAFYAEAAREMVESGDWLTPHYNYEVRFQKPVLYYWLAAAAFKVPGPVEAAARLPAACAGIALVLLTWACGRRWHDDETGFLAGLIATSNFGYFVLGRMALPDLPLAALMTAATWAGLEAARAYGGASAAAGRPRRAGLAWLLVASASAALALLMKGPVGVVLPAAIVVIAARAGLAGPKRWLPAPASALAAAAAVFLAVGAPWYVAMAREHGSGYLYRFFVGENLERFATDRYNEPRTVFFYVPIVLGGLAPWSAFLPLWVPGAWAALRRRRLDLSGVDLTLAIWALVPFLFYSLSIGKQPRYILPILPPLAILLASTLRVRLHQALTTGTGRRALAVLGSLAGLLIIVLGALLLWAAPLLEEFSPTPPPATAALVILGGAIVAAMAIARPRLLPLVLTAVSVATLVGLHFAVFSTQGAEPVQRMAAAYREARTDTEPSATHRAFVRNLIFYTGVPQTDLDGIPELAAFLRRPERVLCVLRQRDLDRLEREQGLRPRVLASLRYFNTAGVRLKTLLWPTPAKDLEEVHLVTNR